MFPFQKQLLLEIVKAAKYFRQAIIFCSVQLNPSVDPFKNLWGVKTGQNVFKELFYILYFLYIFLNSRGKLFTCRLHPKGNL